MVLAAGGLSCWAADMASMNRVAGERALMTGRADDAVKILHQVVVANPKDAAAHLLLCRVFYSEELPDEAVSECEAALASGLGNDSKAQDWMGRAYGRKADKAGPFGGLSLARKVKAAFELAVQLDPSNAAAVNDLSEYYVGAPSMVGGGLDKAQALADRVAAKLPESSHRMRAMAAEKDKDYGTAEREFKAVVGVAGHADAWTDLGDFYARRKQKDQAIVALHKAIEVDTAKDASLVDVASVLHTIKREPDTAERALRDYLASNAKSDAAPAFKAHYELGKVLSSEGNKAGAKSEYQAALALAANYAPARKAMEAQ